MVRDEKLLPKEQRESIQNLRNKIKQQFQDEMEILHAQKYLLKLISLRSKEVHRENKNKNQKRKNKIKPRKRTKHVATESSPETTEIAIRVHDLRILDSDYDPLPVFLVRSTYGGKSATVYKRFDQFEELHSSLKPKNLAAQLPKKSDAFGEETDELLLQLTKYMLIILKEKRIAHSRTLRHFLGHSEESDDYADIFDWAMKRITAFSHNIVYHDPVEGLTKYIVHQICYEDETVKRPDQKNKQEFLEFLRIVMKATAEDVSEFWFQMKKEFETVELSLNNFSDMRMLLDEFWGYIHTTQTTTQETLGEYLNDYHAITVDVLNQMMDPMKYLYKYFENTLGVCSKLKQEFCDPKCAVLSDQVEIELYDSKRIIKDIPPQLYEKMGEIAARIPPPFTKLRLFFTCFNYVIEGLTGFFQIRNVVVVLNEMMARKAGIVKDVEYNKKRIDTLEEEISIFLWRFERDGIFDVWRTFYEIEKKVAVEYASLTPDEKPQLKEYFYALTHLLVKVSDFCVEVIHNIQKALKKVWWKSMDYLTTKTLNKRKKELNIEVIIQEAFEFGMEKMVKHMRKHILRTMTTCIVESFSRVILEDIMDQCQASQLNLEISEQYLKIMPFEIITRNAFLFKMNEEIEPTVFKWMHFFVMKDVKIVKRKKNEAVETPIKIQSENVVEKKMEFGDQMEVKDNDENNNITANDDLKSIRTIRSIRTKTTRTELLDGDLEFDCQLTEENETDYDSSEEDEDEEEEEKKMVDNVKTKQAYGIADLSSKLNFSDILEELNLDLSETTYSSGSEDMDLFS
ncbi:PX domain-containing protein [Entamoeba marina]